MRTTPTFLAPVLPGHVAVSPSAPPPPVTLAVVNARVWTGQARRPWADAVAVRGGRIALVGASAEVRKLAAAAARSGAAVRVHDAGGQMLVPGFIDAHVHLVDGGVRLSSVQARGARTPAYDVARASPALADRALDAAMGHLAAQGVTSVHSMGSWDDLATFERAREGGRLLIRIFAAVPLASWERLRDTVATRGCGDEWVRIGALEGFAEGSPGSHTAAMPVPSPDAPADRGLVMGAPEGLQARVRGADAAGLQLVIHTVGDRGVGVELDLFERVAAENGPRDRRFRLEHAQHVAAADLPRFAVLGVIASMRPHHAIDNSRGAGAVIGSDRARTSDAFRSLRDAGARLAFGGGGFVAPPTPLEGICTAVTGRTLDGRHPGGRALEQTITVEDALRAYTAGGAYASFEEASRGTLERGKLADFALVDRDLTRVPPETIREARVTMTVVGGRVVYEDHAGRAAAPDTP